MSNVVVVGTGYWGRNLVRNFSELDALYGVCDTDLSTLEEMKSKYLNLRPFSGFAEVLSNDEVDGVVIAVPAELHYRLAKEALMAGKDVFCEKPLSLQTEEARELVGLAEKKKRVLMVGHLLEYHPAVLRLKELIDSGELGKVHYIYSSRLNLGKIRREENILWSFAPHDISVTLLLLNEMPVSVSAHGGNYLHHEIADITVTNLSFKSGVKSHIFVSWLHPYKEQRLIVVGSKKMALFDDVAKEDKLLLYPHRIDWIDRIPVPQKENAQRVDFKMGEPLKEECRHFLDCLKTRKQPRTDGNKGVAVLEVLTAAQISLEKNGEPVALCDIGQKDYYTHPTATIDQGCEIGSGTKIWHYCHILKGAKIGKDCNLGQNVVVSDGASLGNNVKVQNNVSIYAGITLEDDVFCGPSMVFTNVTTPRSHVSRKSEYRRTLVKKGATIGANATIVCGITINEYAFIGAGAVVTKDVPANGLVIGNPARVVGWMCWCGEKLEFDNNKAVCARCERGYVKKEGKIEEIISS